MQNATFSLCPECDACPELVIDGSGVRIGEADNMVRLSHAEWNQLVALVRSGELSALGQP